MSTEKKIPISITYGPNVQDFEIDKGAKVGEVLCDAYVREISGFDPEEVRDASYFVNGEKVPAGYKLNANDQVEVIKQAGQKA